MIINWFPGHMKKALETMQDELKICDVVIYMLDARAPFSCVNPSLNEIIKNKPIIYVLNKADLADEVLTKKWFEFFNNKSKAIILNSTEQGSASVIKKILNEFSLKKVRNNIKKSINIPVRVMVLGVPNSGKSTLTNNICNKVKAVAENRPGVTRGKQWVRIDENLEFCDTPGTLWPNLENDEIAHNLAYIGSIKDNVLVLSELCFDFLEKIMQIDRGIIESRYGFAVDGLTTIEVYEKICEVRGFVMRNRELDYERCAKAVLGDFRSGKLGRITLDRNF